MDTPLVWEATLDGGAYKVIVRRTGGYTGVLELRKGDDDTLMFEQNVGLAYGAQFGPDVSDVAEWEHSVEEYLNSHGL